MLFHLFKDTLFYLEYGTMFMAFGIRDFIIDGRERLEIAGRYSSIAELSIGIEIDKPLIAHLDGARPFGICRSEIDGRIGERPFGVIGKDTKEIAVIGFAVVLDNKDIIFLTPLQQIAIDGVVAGVVKFLRRGKCFKVFGGRIIGPRALFCPNLSASVYRSGNIDDDHIIINCSLTSS